ncbi:hypothetical protein PI23P_03172 [Polaribacter irgensii 23-P]|uniref:HTH cro/C1-type domain-containing protein n=1 Tax=Polaribacter irgensii 23-P TaxID=313594 RepID=A4BWX1_9FLAO|nr:helix-turn-helix transcriptional regulator [Polaribacter irgensii]EAR13462.1 hypothetical protein PI23P_03172 [Polaribacter irgensii 23-P]
MATRKHPGVGQRTIVDQTKIGESGYFKIENGRTKLDLQELFEVLGLLEISPEELLKEINYTKGKDYKKPKTIVVLGFYFFTRFF